MLGLASHVLFGHAWQPNVLIQLAASLLPFCRVIKPEKQGHEIHLE